MKIAISFCKISRNSLINSQLPTEGVAKDEWISAKCQEYFWKLLDISDRDNKYLFKEKTCEFHKLLTDNVIMAIVS